MTNFYWDPENIKKGNGPVYSWFLLDYREESPESDSLYMMINVETDCETLASKDLTYVSYKQHMAGGGGSKQNRYARESRDCLPPHDHSQIQVDEGSL